MATLQLLADVVAGLKLWLPLLLIFIGAAIAAWIVNRTLIRTLRKIVDKTRTKIDDLLLHGLQPGVVFFAFMVALWAGLSLFEAYIPPGSLAWIQGLGFIAIALMVAMMGARLIQGLLRHQVRHQPQFGPAAILGDRVAHLVIYLIAFLIVLDHYDVQIAPILTSLGIAGLAVALALQDTLANFFAGLWIQTARNVTPGNFVRIEGVGLDVQGYVVEVGWRTTMVQTLAGNYALIPNSKLTQNVILNFHLPRPDTMIRLSFPVNQDIHPDEMERILVGAARDAAKSFDALRTDPAPQVQILDDPSESTVRYTLLVHVRDLPDQYRAQHEIRKRVLAEFAQQRIRAASGARTLVGDDLGVDEGGRLEAERSQGPSSTESAVAADHIRRKTFRSNNPVSSEGDQ